MIPRLFIVDDEALARQRMRMLLSDIASECPTVIAGEAEHAQAALEALSGCHADIVLLDGEGQVVLELLERVVLWK